MFSPPAEIAAVLSQRVRGDAFGVGFWYLFRYMRSLSSCLVALLAAASIPAQTPSATLMGHVTDEAGAPVAVARVEITSVETNETESFVTGADGNFSALQLPVGAYRSEERRVGEG